MAQPEKRLARWRVSGGSQRVRRWTATSTDKWTPLQRFPNRIIGIFFEHAPLNDLERAPEFCLSEEGAYQSPMPVPEGINPSKQGGDGADTQEGGSPRWRQWPLHPPLDRSLANPPFAAAVGPGLPVTVVLISWGKELVPAERLVNVRAATDHDWQALECDIGSGWIRACSFCKQIQGDSIAETS